MARGNPSEAILKAAMRPHSEAATAILGLRRGQLAFDVHDDTRAWGRTTPILLFRNPKKPRISLAPVKVRTCNLNQCGRVIGADCRKIFE